jgi:hypothetical protein
MRDVAIDHSAISRRRLVTGAVVFVVAALGTVLGLTSDPVWLGLGIVSLFVSLVVLGPLVAAPVARHARAVALIGRDAAAIEGVLQGSGVTMQRHDTLEAATLWCFEQAQAGDAVLLSPACASLDMFRNYAHRAQVFADTVKALALEHGEVVA